jgi:hypothetical protein
MKKGKAACGFPLFHDRKNTPESGFFIAILALGLDLDFIFAIRSLFEVADTLAQSAADFGESARSEYNQNNNQNYDQFGHTKSKHISSSETLKFANPLSLFSVFGSIAPQAKKIKYW